MGTSYINLVSLQNLLLVLMGFSEQYRISMGFTEYFKLYL